MGSRIEAGLTIEGSLRGEGELGRRCAGTGGGGAATCVWALGDLLSVGMGGMASAPWTPAASCCGARAPRRAVVAGSAPAGCEAA